MLSKELQETVRTLSQRGMGVRAISRALVVSRNSVRSLLRASASTLPAPSGTPPAEQPRQSRLELLVRYLFKECAGSALRIQECLQKDYTLEIGYSTLTRFVRVLGLRPRHRGNRAHPEILTGPGEEMQLDTSPIWVKLGSVRVKLYLANLICGFSRHRHAEWFPRWRRFHVKVFLVRALRALGGVCKVVQIDNGREIVILGSGVDAVVAMEMERFASRLGFRFAAVEAGDKDRQGKVEKAHQFVQQNFLKGRRFRDLADLNRQTAEWCQQIFARKVRGQSFAPADRWEQENAHLQALPVFITEPSQFWKRRVDDRGRISLHHSTYRVPDRFVLQWLTVQETADEIVVLSGREEICRHMRFPECDRKHSPLPGYRENRSKRAPAGKRSPEEVHLRTLGPEVSLYLDALEARPLRNCYARLRRLYRFSCEYPAEIFLPTLHLALARRAFDLNRLEAVLEEKMGERIRDACLPPAPQLEARAAYRRGQVTPHRLRPLPESSEETPGVKQSFESPARLPGESARPARRREEEE
ncbi:MAG: transposase [Acidobacteria bacterium]|nr:transposase [Acidobacteriota bacterium]